MLDALKWLGMGYAFAPMPQVDGSFRELCRMGLARVSMVREKTYYRITEAGIQALATPNPQTQGGE